MKKAIPILFLMLLLSGCQNHFPFVYHTDVQQGNVLDDKKVAQLKKGMTIPQVEYLLGTTISADTFVSHRWDYVYYLKPNRGPVQHRRVTLLFNENNEVTKVIRHQDDTP